MSIFIANLAFTENAMIQGSILSVLMASLLAGMIGFTLSSYAFPKHAEKSG
jgi:Na+/H+ antiporter NhaA